MGMELSARTARLRWIRLEQRPTGYKPRPKGLLGRTHADAVGVVERSRRRPANWVIADGAKARPGISKSTNMTPQKRFSGRPITMNAAMYATTVTVTLSANGVRRDDQPR